MAQAREVLIEMSEGQEITAEQDEWQATIKKHDDAEFSAEFPEQETGTISLLDASQDPAGARGPRPLPFS